jgi:hypothetical protein
MSKEVRHILRQNGNIIEEVIAIRNGRTIRYVKKDNLGRTTNGTKIIGFNNNSNSKIKPVEQPKMPKKQSLTDKINNFLESDTILE